jgi:hypothetical protein
MSLVWVLLVAVARLLLLVAAVFSIAGFLAADGVASLLVMVGHRRARHAPKQEGAGDQQEAKIADAVEKSCHLTKSLPTNARWVPGGRGEVKICAVRRLRSLVIAGFAITAIGACGPFCLSGKITLSSAHVDPSYKCPNPARDLPYDVHGSVDVDNSTRNTLTIKSMSEAGILVDVHGAWNIGSVGQKFDNKIVNFTPKTIKSGDKSTVRFSWSFNCTNSGPAESTYGDFDLKFTMVTSGGTYTISGASKHRLVIT